MTTVFDGGYALLIGVDQNRDSTLALPAVAHDVAGLHSVLSNQDHCAYAPEHIRRVTGAQSTRTGILDGLGWLRDALDADESGNSTAVISPGRPVHCLESRTSNCPTPAAIVW